MLLLNITVNTKAIRNTLLLMTFSLGLVACGDYSGQEVPELDLTTQQEDELYRAMTLNFLCGGFGRYSSFPDAPIVYQPYFDNARFIASLINVPLNHQDKLALAVLKDIEKVVERNSKDMTLEKALEIIDQDVSNTFHLKPSRVKDCHGVSAFTRRTLDKIALSEKTKL